MINLLTYRIYSDWILPLSFPNAKCLKLKPNTNDPIGSYFDASDMAIFLVSLNIIFLTKNYLITVLEFEWVYGGRRRKNGVIGI